MNISLGTADIEDFLRVDSVPTTQEFFKYRWFDRRPPGTVVSLVKNGIPTPGTIKIFIYRLFVYGSTLIYICLK